MKVVKLEKLEAYARERMKFAEDMADAVAEEHRKELWYHEACVWENLLDNELEKLTEEV